MRNTRKMRRLLAFLVGAGLAFGAAPFAFAQSVKVEFPAKPDATELPEVWPEEAGVSSDHLVKLSQWIRDQKFDIRSLVIVKDGKIVFERYSVGPDPRQELRTLFDHQGADRRARRRSDRRGQDPVSTVRSWTSSSAYRPDLKDALADKGKIKLRNVLTMTTGLHYDFNAAERSDLLRSARPAEARGRRRRRCSSPAKCSNIWTSIRSWRPRC